MQVNDEAVEAARRIRDTAMKQTVAARIPESGHFGAIAQDADWLVDHLSPAPVGVTDDHGWLFLNPDTGTEYSESHPIESGECPDAEDIRAATPETLLSELLDSWKAWAEDRDEVFRLREALASHGPAPSDDECETCVGTGLVEDAATSLSLGKGGFKPCPDCAPTDTQEGVSEAGEVVGYRWRDVINPEYWHVGKAHKAPSYASKEPLVRQSALTACQQEVETLREGIKEIAELYQDIHGSWKRHDAETSARILELEVDLEIERDKLRRLTDALTPSAEKKAAYMGEFHMGVTLMHNGDEDHRRVMIPWTSIKEIMAAIRARGGQSNEA